MKIIKYNLILLLCFGLFTPACDEDSRLTEVPVDFYSPENAYITKNDFQAAINNLYWRVRNILWSIDADTRFAYYYATDFAYNATNYQPTNLGKLNDYKNVMVPTFSVVSNTWKEFYGIISDANVILARIDASTSQVSDTDRPAMKGEAKFFRAFAYRVLGHLFGGVPIVVDEITVPKLDFVRASREQVYQQCVADLKDAVGSLQEVDKVTDGKVNKHVALHLLSEIYICLGQWDDAINAASEVINYSGTELMRQRFGTYRNDAGDVYGDLFCINNQNRSGGNKESLWVLQYDYNNTGSSSAHNWPWTIIPFYQTLTLDGETLFAGVTDRKCGRGVGWIRPTNHFFYSIWQKDGQTDIRNSATNIVRDVRIDNPNSPYFRKWMVKDGINKDPRLDTIRNWFPLMTKVGLTRDFPEDLYVSKDKNDTTEFGERLVLNGANSAYKDEYMFRLAETYLLRAEAYIGKGEPANALTDINEIRSRANASPADISEMNIDYILDERLRELYTEETRMFTLTRMGKLAERNRKYNPYSGKSIEDYHNLWPIPYSEIERNTMARIEQNPGYTN